MRYSKTNISFQTGISCIRAIEGSHGSGQLKILELRHDYVTN